ncbi:LuxR C-terminal-related transcriptional regulator [Ralstonia syzygii subsp. celebesensis]|uniref:LuxR C-terminal-related transcriptional regulator n=1 Tax=Ralstonia syzygii TaxID=28097 RepID=UPI000992BF67|nr:hypothetical protein JK151_03155 [Ralstonia syzygii subsp. celebesensis]
MPRASAAAPGVATCSTARYPRGHSGVAVRCCLDGLSVTDIAGKFARSIKAIRSQKRSAFRKLGIRTDTELFRTRHEPEWHASVVLPVAFGKAPRDSGRRPE